MFSAVQVKSQQHLFFNSASFNQLIKQEINVLTTNRTINNHKFAFVKQIFKSTNWHQFTESLCMQPVGLLPDV